MSLAAEASGVCTEEVKKRPIRKAWAKCGLTMGSWLTWVP